MTARALETIPIDELRPWPRNARTHSRKQLRQIAESIRRFGFTNPVLIDGENRILAGHGRVEAAGALGMPTAPCLRFDHMSAAEQRAYVLADNKLALNAGWDEELLALELKELMETEIDFDVGLTGFSIAEVDQLIEGLAPSEPGHPADDWLPDPGAAPSRCRTGDIWRLGPHRLVCGDALDLGVVADLMDGELAEMVFTDPPYNVAIEGNVSGLGEVRHREFAMASGEMTRAEFTAFLSSAFENLVACSLDGSNHFVCMDWRHMGEMVEAGATRYAELKNLIVWAKDNGGMGSFYRSRHELIFAFKKGTAAHQNSFELGQHGRYRTNVWEYRGVNTLKSGRLDELALHPTVKPVAMIADAIKDVSRRGAVVLDLFGGSGSTLIAAHKTSRRARLCELDPVDCDRILQRWETFAKDDAELVACGRARQARNAIAFDGEGAPRASPDDPSSTQRDGDEAAGAPAAATGSARDRGRANTRSDPGRACGRSAFARAERARRLTPKPRDRKPRLPTTHEPAPYDVGYRKPPPASQFKPGRSGNPKGRPKGARNKRPALNEERLKGIILDEAYRAIKVTEGARQVSIPMAQAVIRALAVNAARGQHRAQQLFAELLHETERANRALHDEYLQTVIAYKCDWEREFERRERLGLAGPQPLPHPDDIIIDFRSGQVIMKGPMTKEEKAEWDRMYARIEECACEIKELTAMLQERKNKRFRRLIEDDIAHERRIREMLVNAVGEPKNRRR